MMCRLILLFFLLLHPLCTLGEPKSSSLLEEAPAEWRELESLLTPYEEAVSLPSKKIAAVESAGGGVERILDEEIVRVSADGSEISVSHSIAELRLESAQSRFSKRTIQMRGDKEDVYIALARTISPSGESILVEPEGIFIESGEADEDIDIYSDSQKIRVIFPAVEVGCRIEIIWVTKSQPIIENAWTAKGLYQDIYPIRKKRFVLEFPIEEEPRLKVWQHRLSMIPQREVLEDDSRLRYSWEKTLISPAKLEHGMPSILHHLPQMRVGIGANWDGFADWYSQLIVEASSDIQGLGQLAEEWAEGATDPRQITENLFSHVSQDIRYTGLEFGEGAFKPRSPASVVGAGYGDCKDKSNLLRVLLRHHGISSRIGLIQTQHSGMVPKKIASVGLFNHAILAVDLPEVEQPIVCDPTLSGAPFGLLPFPDSDRDLLLIDENGSYEWMKTPVYTASKLDVVADLEIGDDGVFSGWFTVRMDGILGYLLQDFFLGKTREERCEEGLKQFFSYISRVRVVDCEDVTVVGSKVGEAGGDMPFHYRFYVTQAKDASLVDAKTVGFRLPLNRYYVTPVGKSEAQKRHNPYIVSPQESRLLCTLKYPEDWQVLDRPKDWERNGDQYRLGVKAVERGQLGYEVEMIRGKGIFTAGEFEKLASDSREGWQVMSAPVLWMRQGDGRSSESRCSPESLPVMPSGDGFSSLIHHHFPLDPADMYGADHDSRIKAFRRMAELYSEDEEAVFLAETMLSVSQLLQFPSEKKTQRVVTRLQRLRANRSGSISAEKVAAAELTLAEALFLVGDNDAGVELCEDLYVQADLPDVIRQAAAYLISVQVAEENPLRGIELAEFGLLNHFLPSDVRDGLVGLILDCRLRLPDPDSLAITQEMLGYLEEMPDRSDELRAVFLDAPSTLADYGHQDRVSFAVEMLRAGGSSLGFSDENLKDLDVWYSALLMSGPIYDELIAYLDVNPWPDADKIEKGDAIECASDCYGCFHESELVAFRYELMGCTRYGPQADIADRFSELVDKVFYFDDETMEGLPDNWRDLIGKVIELWKKSPSGDIYNAEDAWVSEGELTELFDGPEEADALYLRLIGDESFSREVRQGAIQSLQAIRVDAGNFDRFVEVIDLHLSLGDEDGGEFLNFEVIRGAYLCLANARYEDAWRFFEGVVAVEEGVEPEAIRSVVQSLIENREASEKWWAESKGWWRLWKDIANDLGVESDAQSDWEYYTCWRAVDLADIKKVKKKKNIKKQRKLMRELLSSQLEYTRWHRGGVEMAIKLLKLHSEKIEDSRINDLIGLLQNLGGPDTGVVVE